MNVPPEARLQASYTPWQNDLVLMKERPFFTAALVFSSPSLVPSLAAFTSFCIFKSQNAALVMFNRKLHSGG